MKHRTFRLDKLVRDNIISQHIEQGAKVVFRELPPEERRQALAQKAAEEILEFLESGSAEELADAKEALEQLATDSDISMEEITVVQAEKRQKNGGFEQGLHIEQETWPADHHWATYYAADPKRFPEVK